jgi:hypothetical protein
LQTLKTKGMIGFVRSDFLVDRGGVGVAATGFDSRPRRAFQLEGSMEAGVPESGVLIGKEIILVLGCDLSYGSRR